MIPAAGSALVLAGLYVYYTTPGDDTIGGVQARYFAPLLVLVPIAVGSVDVRWLRAHEARVPVARRATT